MAERIGRYLIFEKVAAGGTASVHLARPVGVRGFARCLAAKRLHPHLATDSQLALMLLDEARLTGRIRSPFVVQTLDVVAEGDELVVVMEYVLGEALSGLLRRSRDRAAPEPAIASAILVNVLTGLHAAHELRGDDGESLRLVHRDVSPQNVLVGADGVARVVDFGIAKAVGRAQTTQAGALKGKLAYMAPEQLLARGVDRRTDVFAAATMFWETLTGRRLFASADEVTTIGKIIGGKVAPPSTLAASVGPALDQVILRGLAQDPEDRFSTALAMAAAVEAAIAVAPPSRVAEWLDAVMHDEIESRRNRVHEIEHAGSLTSE